MKLSTKILLVNLGIAAGLAIQLYRGADVVVTSLTGAFLLIIANALIFRSYKKRRLERSSD